MNGKNIKYSLILITSLLVSFAIFNRNVLSNDKPKDLSFSEEHPYLILISLDGFRWDYVERFKPPHLSEFIQNGVQAESLIPSFPTKTFPNHYSIATGMYPDHHGIIDNKFYSYELDSMYNVTDGRFYKGNPIWVNAAKEGLVTASYFFIGTEAEIQGIKPTYTFKYDGEVANEIRVKQALDWLDLPIDHRPQLMTLYFSDMDDYGHRHGSNNDRILKEQLLALDQILGSLLDGIKESGLPVNVMIVSDHGMIDINKENFISSDQFNNNDLYKSIDNGQFIQIHPNNLDDIDTIYQMLKANENHYTVHKITNAPGFEYVPHDKNWGSILVIPDKHYYFSSNRLIKRRNESSIHTSGQHGLDPTYKEMHGIFYAKGPAFKKGYVTPAVKNIHLYPIMCKVLGLEIPDDIDGSLEELEGVLVGN